MILEAREAAAEIKGCVEKGIDGLMRKKYVFVSKQCTCDELGCQRYQVISWEGLRISFSNTILECTISTFVNQKCSRFLPIRCLSWIEAQIPGDHFGMLSIMFCLCLHNSSLGNAEQAQAQAQAQAQVSEVSNNVNNVNSSVLS